MNTNFQDICNEACKYCLENHTLFWDHSGPHMFGGGNGRFVKQMAILSKEHQAGSGEINVVDSYENTNTKFRYRYEEFLYELLAYGTVKHWGIKVQKVK